MQVPLWVLGKGRFDVHGFVRWLAVGLLSTVDQYSDVADSQITLKISCFCLLVM